MSFETPGLLWGLLLIPLVMAAYLLAQRRRRRYAVRFTNLDLLANVVTASPRWRRHLPPLLTLLALSALVVALARPQAEIKTPRERASVMLTTDVSGSMQATDVEPDRLSAARAAAKTFSEQIPSKFRLGLVSFNQQSRVHVPPTTDRGLVRRALDDLEAGGGTAIGDAIETSLTALSELTANAPQQRQRRGRRRTPAVVVLLSDGKNTGGPDPLEMAAEARRRGVSINTVALGTASGTVELLDDQGFPRTIPVPPDPETLSEIARTTGGRFFDAPDADELKTIYERLGSRIGYDVEKKEITFIFAGAGLALLIMSGVMSLAWFGRLP
jgi:Ca-activated chloride channel family protein